MPIGGGVYEDACDQAQKATNAESVILMVIGGNKGNGFSVLSRDPLFSLQLPQILRAMAENIEMALPAQKEAVPCRLNECPHCGTKFFMLKGTQ